MNNSYVYRVSSNMKGQGESFRVFVYKVSVILIHPPIFTPTYFHIHKNGCGYNNVCAYKYIAPTSSSIPFVAKILDETLWATLWA